MNGLPHIQILLAKLRWQWKVFIFSKETQLGGGFKDFLFSPLPGEMIQFDDHIFQMGGSTTN